jgi:hypothetical protein
MDLEADGLPALVAAPDERQRLCAANILLAHSIGPERGVTTPSISPILRALPLKS